MGQVAAVGGLLWACFWRQPTGHPRVDQWHGLLLASAWVLLWTWTRQKRWTGWAWCSAWALPVAVSFQDSYGFAWLWLASWLCVTLACAALGASDDRSAIRTAVLLVGTLQVPFVLADWLGQPVWQCSGGGVCGSLGKRYVLGALWGLCSLWSTGWRAWAWAGCSLVTGSWVGALPAAARLISKPRWRSLAWILLGCISLKVSPVAFSSRLGAWWDGILALWPPVGFGNFRAGFLGDGMVDRLLSWGDHHSAALDLLARFGWWGGVLVVAVAYAFLKRTGPWVSCWAALLLGAQSVESYPVTAYLAAMALLGGCDGVGTVQAVGADDRGRPSGARSLPGHSV